MREGGGELPLKKTIRSKGKKKPMVGVGRASTRALRKERFWGGYEKTVRKAEHWESGPFLGGGRGQGTERSIGKKTEKLMVKGTY